MKVRRFLSAAALAAASAFASMPASAAIVVSFSPSSSHISIGESTAVEMRISGLGDEILKQFDITFTFGDPPVDNTSVIHNAVVSAFGGAANSFWGSTFGPGETRVVDGSNLTDAELVASQPNDFVVLTFTLLGIADGATTLGLSTGWDERRFFGLQRLNPTIGTACVAVGTGSCPGSVPEPAAIGLLAMALAAAGVAGRVRRRRDVRA